MRTWTDKRDRFQLQVPQGWSCPGALSRLFSPKYRRFAAPDRYLVVETGTSSDVAAGAASCPPKRWALRGTEHETGSSPIDGRKQVWAVQRVPRPLISEIAAAREIFAQFSRAYADVGFVNERVLLDEFDRKDMGPVIKRYLIVIGAKEYEVTCALGLGTLSEVRESSRESEQDYDAIAASLRRV